MWPGVCRALTSGIPSVLSLKGIPHRPWRGVKKFGLIKVEFRGHYRRTNGLAKGLTAGYVIGLAMGFKGMGDGTALAFGKLLGRQQYF